MSLQSGKSDQGSLDQDLLYKLEDPALDAKIKYFRKAELELQEILIDPGLKLARHESASMIISFRERKKTSSGEIETFVKSSLDHSGTQASEDLKEIKAAIAENDINDISAEWVSEWHRKKQMEVLNPANEERKRFIASALSEKQAEKQTANEELHSEKVAPVVSIKKNQGSGRKIIRVTTVAAAAMLGVFIAIRTLTPSGNTEKIFDSYYKSFTAVSTTTRGENIDKSGIYNSAINYYKAGNYALAEAGFTASLKADPGYGDPLFYLGLSQIETGNIDRAIDNLTAAAGTSANVKKEATWYLGFAHLKKGDKIKARECFLSLTNEDGFYRESAEGSSGA